MSEHGHVTLGTGERREWSVLGAAALGVGLLVVGAAWIAPRLMLDARIAFAVAFAAVTLEILGLAASAPTPRAGPLVALVIGASILLFCLHGAPAAGGSAALLSVALGVAMVALGAALGRRIDKPGQLVAVALVSALADLWSVFDPTAPSARLAEQTLADPHRLSAFALPFPLLGTNLISAIIGAGDVLFAGLYVAAFRAHGLSVRRALVALGVGFLVGLLGLLALERALPLLPLLGAAVVASDSRARSLSGREWRTVGFVCAVLIGAIALRMAR